VIALFEYFELNQYSIALNIKMTQFISEQIT